MKELIDRLNEVRGNIFNSDRYAGISDDQPEHDDMQTVLEAIAALEAVEAREAELRARVAELEEIVSHCQIMGFLQPKLDCSPTHRELVKRAAAAMAKEEV